MVAAAVMVGEICSRMPENIWRGNVALLGPGNEDHCNHFVERGAESEHAHPKSCPAE